MTLNDSCISDKIGGLHLFGINKCIDFTSLACIPVGEMVKEKPSLRNILRGVKQFFRTNLIQQYEYFIDFKPENKIVLFYGGYWYRDDHYKAFCEFSDRFNYCDKIIAKKINRITPLRFFISIVLLHIWIVQAFVQRFPIRFLLYLSPYMSEANKSKKLFNITNERKYKLLVTYSDLTPDENCLVQYFNSNKIPTATLQHGQFSIKSNRSNEKFEGIQFIYSPSKYFLCWNQYTKDMISKAGLNPDKYIVLGMPKYINFRPDIYSDRRDKNTFGVVLNVYSKEFDKQNIQMIEMANLISKNMNMKYLVRYHPTMDSTRYQKYYNEKFQGVENSKTILEYSSKVDFSIIGSSSVFIELTYLNHLCFRLQTGSNDYYSDIPFAYFSTIEEFMDLVGNDKEIKSQREHLFEYLCTSYDIYENYDGFFKSMIAESSRKEG